MRLPPGITRSDSSYQGPARKLHVAESMDAILQAQFQRVETALNSLIDSISAYTPSPVDALALIEADDELSRGLEQRKSTIRVIGWLGDSRLIERASSD